MPLVSISTNVLFSRFEYTKEDGRYFFPIGFFYLMMNFIGTKIRGVPLYPFMPWTSLKTPAIGISLVFSLYVSYLFSYWLVTTIKGRRKDRND
jgi:hypothetical protein